MERKAKVDRKTKETKIVVELNIDGTGEAEVVTGVPFLDHMLTLMTAHGLFDISVKASGDLEVDYHHTVEDIGIALGKALRESLGDKAGCRRFGSALIPMDEALAQVAVDLSGRAGFFLEGRWPKRRIKDLDPGCLLEFLKSLAQEGLLTVHVNLMAGSDPHHMVEAVFKSLGRALDEATSIDVRRHGIPSTKGVL